jgi:hypothetical protein
MLRLGTEVMHPVLRHLRLELRLPPPTRVLPTIVRQHLLRRLVFRGRPPVYLQDLVPSLGHEQVQADNITRIIIDEPNQIRVLPAQLKRRDVRLPKLVRRRPFEPPWLGRPHRVSPLPGRHGNLHTRSLQGPPYRLLARPHEKYPPQQVANPPNAAPRMPTLQRYDLRLHRRRYFGRSATTDTIQQTRFPFLPVTTAPTTNR